MTKSYQNAMAITRILGKTSFVTFTANPKWPEILRQLKPGQTADSRPDLVAIVFKQKLDALHELKVTNIFGKCVGDVFTIEYQKRGLPHAHILIFLQDQDVPRIEEDVDKIIQARLPTNDPALAEINKGQMTHGPHLS
ncbi:putative atp-dependent dna helicase pif1 [Erysiphe necator]|uniref:Putative atp-dependent dna helicase pif1 n=1 Tax=Uncinula necator TaxID=52586 RepID=A0A0B1PA64_UNCNE|nr:putative atp-dependent dna helicase pif1 [Erysiphe necator]